MSTRPLRKLRRSARRAFGRLLSRVAPRPPELAPFATEELRRILVCRVNRRLGNLVLLTPLLRSLAASIPNAEIDVLIANPAHAALFAGWPVVSRVETLEPRAARGLLAVPSLARRIWKRRYDLAIDPCLSSTTNRAALMLAGARHRLGFANVDGWAPLTHAVPPSAEMRHEALRPLELLQATISAPSLSLQSRLDLGLSPKELEAGLDSVVDACARESLEPWMGGSAQPSRTRAPVVGFFADAAKGKGLPVDWWLAWARELEDAVPGVRLAQVLPPAPSSAERLIPSAIPLQSADPRRLASMLANLTAFVCADTGPMHLASAALVPTFGLFRNTDPVQYRPYGPKDRVIHVGDRDPGGVGREVADFVASLPVQSVS